VAVMGLREAISIRPEQPEDYPDVFLVNERAFGTSAEARLVDSVRPVVRPFISLVAVLEDKVVGHILFTPVAIEGDTKAWRAMALGPMSVLPKYQNQGIGSRLVLAGLEACRQINEPVVFVLGHPGFYPRFGFQPAAEKGLRYKHSDFDPYFMVTELVPGALNGMSGLVKYHSEFDKL
jgi:putative acetyltransferase